jgi:hypothetical protein
MSLKQWLAKMGQGLEEVGPVFGEMGRKGAEKIGLPGVGRKIGEATVRHPRIAGAVGGAGLSGIGGAAGFLASHGARELDELTADPDRGMPPQIEEAFGEAGFDPREFEDAGMHPGAGAFLGVGGGSLAHLLRGSPGGLKGLAKYMAIAGLGGGALGAMTRTYKKRDER